MLADVGSVCYSQSTTEGSERQGGVVSGEETNQVMEENHKW